MNRIKTYLLASTVPAMLAGLTPAFAADDQSSQEAAQPDNSSGGIGDIIVTARKRSESAQSVPVAITAFSPETLQDRQIVNITDVSYNTSGLTLQMSSTTQQFVATMRGQNTLDSTLNLDPAVGIYVDGVYIGPDVGNAIALNFDDAANVEVLKGPQGTLYGRNTSAGAIKLDHQLPGYEVAGWITGELGSYDLHTIKGAMTVPLVDQVASLRLYGRYTARSGFGRNTTQGVDVNDNKNYSFAGALRLDPAPNLQIVVRGYYDNDKSGGPSVVPVAILPTTNLQTLAIAAENGLPINADQTLTPAVAQQAADLFFSQGPRPGSYDMTSRYPTPNNLQLYGGSVNISYDVTPDLQIKSITGYRHINIHRGIDYSGTAATSNIAVDEPLNYHQFSEELNLNGSLFADKFKYTLGAFYMNAKGRDTQAATTTPVLGEYFGPTFYIPTGINVQDGIQRTTSYAIYGQASYEIVPGLNITGGLRYTKEHKNLTSFNQFKLGSYNRANGFIDLFPPVLNQTVFCSQPNQGVGDACNGYQPYTFSKVTWLGSVDYKISPDVLVYAKVSRGFRSGGGQLRLGGKGDPFGPETVDDYEIGIKADFFNNRARVNVAAYIDDYSDLQKQVVAVVDNAISAIIKNAARARIKGIEFDAMIEPVDGLTLGWSGAYTDAKYLSYMDNGVDLSGQKFQNVAKFVWTLSAAYQANTSFGKMSANVGYWHTSDVPLAPGGGVGANGANPWDTQKAYGLLSARISADIGEKVSVGVWGKNLTNKYFYTYGLDLTGSLGYAVNWGGSPRTWGADVTYRF